MLFDSELQHVDEHREQKQRQRDRDRYGKRLAPAEVVTRYSCPLCGGPHARAEHGTREISEESG
jgi:hypothetical protein